MNKVYVITGWFGDQEWIEEIHADKERAEVRCFELWALRHSDKEPEYLKKYNPIGLSKFAVEEYEIIE